MAYSSIASLMRTIEPLLTSNPLMQSIICDHREDFRVLHEKVSSLEIFLRNFEKSNNSAEMTDLEAQIKKVANVVEHTVQLRLTETLMAKKRLQKKKALEALHRSLQQVTKFVDHVRIESTKIQDKGKQESKKSLIQDSSSAKGTLNVKNNMVGRDDQRERLLEDLTRGFSGETKVIPIVGMGGIGKTTLAKDVFNAAPIRSHFDVRAWATISHQHNVKDILASLLLSTTEKVDTEKVDTEDEAELADILQKSLKTRRYLIVLDDMWSAEAWDDVRQCFPSENRGSRILLTTRNTEIACYASAENPPLQMNLMGPVESWNLFLSAAFANEALPSEFETIGKKIVDKCKGLPLTIVVVSGLLSKSKRAIEDWEDVAKDVMSYVSEDPDKQCLHVLGVSYNNLTSDLKACLLYFGSFPEDSEFSVKDLVWIWMAEGFLKLEKDLEGEAEKCLRDLVDRCLVLVSGKSRDETKIKFCKVHDLIYDLCLRESQRQDSFIKYEIMFDPFSSECHPLQYHKMRPFKGWTADANLQSVSYTALLTPGHCHSADVGNNLLKRTRSIFASRDLSTFTLEAELIHFSLLRVLCLTATTALRRFPRQILSLVWLRYLDLDVNFEIPPEFCRLWNLQTLIVSGCQGFVRFPEKIWELMQIRNICGLDRFYLPKPPNLCVDGKRYLGFSNIHTISGLSPNCCTKEVISGIRDVKKLKIAGNPEDYEGYKANRLFLNLIHLHQLETLSVELERAQKRKSKIYRSPVVIPSAKAFPIPLKKLKLKGTLLKWKDLNTVGEFPNLEVLKLSNFACEGEEWCPIVGGFTRLKLLVFGLLPLKRWKATSDNFPVLERLIINDCKCLEEIPIEFAEINSLQLIELNYCKPKLRASAAEIQQEQEDFGIKPVEVRIHNNPDDDDDDGDEEDEDEEEEKEEEKQEEEK